MVGSSLDQSWQGSLLSSTSRTSSTCTGAYTSEMSLAVIEKNINDSAVLPFGVSFRPTFAFEQASVVTF